MVLFSHFSAWSGSGPACPLFPAEQQHLCLGVTQRTLFLWWRGIMRLQSSFLWASCKSQLFWRRAGKGGCVAHNSQSTECGITARVGTPAKSPTSGCGPQTAPLHSRQLHLLPQARPQSSVGEAWPFPTPCPGPSKQYGPRLCPPMLHPPLRPGRAGAGATLGSPSPTSCQCCCTSSLTPRGHVGAGGAECAWEPPAAGGSLPGPVRAGRGRLGSQAPPGPPQRA